MKNLGRPLTKSSASTSLTPRISHVVTRRNLHTSFVVQTLVYSSRPKTPVATCSVLAFGTFHRSSETSCEIRCPLDSCSVTRQLLFGNESAETHEARTNLAQDTTDTFTAHRPARRWNTHKSHAHTQQQSCKGHRVTRMCELQSGERARTITTTENTCSSPGYPFTSDLSHFSLL